METKIQNLSEEFADWGGYFLRSPQEAWIDHVRREHTIKLLPDKHNDPVFMS